MQYKNCLNTHRSFEKLRLKFRHLSTCFDIANLDPRQTSPNVQDLAISLDISPSRSID